ncbi:unnamed protein product [Musa hybrid cultivar]
MHGVLQQRQGGDVFEANKQRTYALELGDPIDAASLQELTSQAKYTDDTSCLIRHISVSGIATPDDIWKTSIKR